MSCPRLREKNIRCRRSIPNLAQILQIQSISYRIRGQHHTAMPHPWVRINRQGEARHGGSWYECRLDGPRSDSSPRVLVLPAAARRREAAAHASLLGSSGEERQREMDGVLPAGAIAGHRGGMGGGGRGEGARGRARRVRRALQLQLRCGTNDSTKQKEIPSRDASPAAGCCRRMKNLLARSPSQRSNASNDYLLEQLEVARATVIKTTVWRQASKPTAPSDGYLRSIFYCCK